MKLRFGCILLTLLLLLVGCDTGAPSETEETTELIPVETTEKADTTASGTEAPEEPERIYLPRPYIDIEFAENGMVYDRMERVDCTVENESLGDVTVDTLCFDGEYYEIPHYLVSGSGGVLRLTYRELADMYDLYEDLMGGFAMEAFLVNKAATDASSGEQCMISSTQGGGYNLTTLRGKYTASVYTDGAYRNAIWDDGYSTAELTHLVNVYDPSSETISLYVNGECVDTMEAPGLLGLASGECFRSIIIGGDVSTDGTHLLSKSLAVADFKLYRTPLGEDPVKVLYDRAVAELTGVALDYEILESDSEVNDTDAVFNSLFDSFATEIYEPETGLQNPPTVLMYADEGFEALSGKTVRPATVLFHTALENGVLTLRTRDGKSLGTALSAVMALNKRMIPAFYLDDAETGKALTEFINVNCIADCFVICDDVELLQSVADSTFAARPLLDCTALTSIDADALMLTTSKGGVKTVLLSADALNPADVTALRARAIGVVAVLGENADTAEIHNAVHCAVSGVLTDDSDSVFDYYKTIEERTLSITPLMVAHRGDPESHPDNMIRSLVSAAESGATSIEFDVWLTKDGHLVLNHDKVTTNFSESLECTKSTRAELEALVYEGPHAAAGDKIAFLDEVFELFSTEYPDKILTVEVKDAREVTIDAIVRLAEEYGMTGRIQLIGMNHLVSHYTYEQYGLSAQMNQSYLVKKANPELSLKLGVMESTLLHSACFTQHSQEHPDFMKGIAHRLVKYSTWTSSSLSSTYKNYLCGVTEYTSNFPHAIDDFYRYLTVSVAEDGTVKVTGVTYKGETVDVTDSAELVVLSGSGTLSDGKLSGTGTFAFRLKNAVPTVENSDYYLYTPAVVR